jgi:hypothetical protein
MHTGFFLKRGWFCSIWHGLWIKETIQILTPLSQKYILDLPISFEKPGAFTFRSRIWANFAAMRKGLIIFFLFQLLFIFSWGQNRDTAPVGRAQPENAQQKSDTNKSIKNKSSKNNAIPKAADTPSRAEQNLPAVGKGTRPDTSVRQDTPTSRQREGQPATTIDKTLSEGGSRGAEITRNALTDSLSRKILAGHPYFNFSGKASAPPYSKKAHTSHKDLIFYLLIAFLFLLAGFRNTFEKYFQNLTELFFRRTLRQRQLRQQVSQNSTAALIFNLLFVIVGAIYLALLFQATGKSSGISFWLLFVYSLAGLKLIYVGKYLFLKMLGWIFRIKPVTDAYIFLVFLVNKMFVLFLFPLVIVIALGSLPMKTAGLTLSWILMAGFFLYRFVAAVGIVNKGSRMSVFHLIVFVLSFEVLPILMIYKAVNLYLV